MLWHSHVMEKEERCLISGMIRMEEECRNRALLRAASAETKAIENDLPRILTSKRRGKKVNVNEEVFAGSVIFLDGAGAFLPRKFTL